jgi:hypothetical protein
VCARARVSIKSVLAPPSNLCVTLLADAVTLCGHMCNHAPTNSRRCYDWHTFFFILLVIPQSYPEDVDSGLWPAGISKGCVPWRKGHELEATDATHGSSLPATLEQGEPVQQRPHTPRAEVQQTQSAPPADTCAATSQQTENRNSRNTRSPSVHNHVLGRSRFQISTWKLTTLTDFFVGFLSPFR